MEATSVAVKYYQLKLSALAALSSLSSGPTLVAVLYRDRDSGLLRPAIRPDPIVSLPLTPTPEAIQANTVATSPNVPQQK
jgi:hypothetical protein